MSPQIENRFFKSLFDVLAANFIATVSIVLLITLCGGVAVAQDKGEVYKEAGMLCGQGGGHFSNGDFRGGIPYFLKAVTLYKSINDTLKVANCYQSLGSGYQMLNLSDSSLYYYNRALVLSERMGDSLSMAQCYMWLGSESFNRTFTKQAEEYLMKAARLDSAIHNYGELSQTLCRLGFVYIDYADSSKSLLDIQRAEELFTNASRLQYSTKYDTKRGIDANVGLATVYIFMAEMLDEPKYADSCLYYYKKTLAIPELGNYSHSLVARAYVKYLIYKNQLHDALDYMQNEQQFFRQSKIHSLSYHYELSNLYKKIGDYHQALEHLRVVNTLQKEINSEANTRAVAKAEAEKVAEIEHAKQEKIEADKSRLHSYLIGAILVLCFGSGLVVALFVMARNRKQSNKQLSEKNAQLNSQKDEIAAQKDIIVKQMHEVESINDKLFSSIDYARRIQRATVTPLASIKELFQDCFLFFSPCDMVSGDFYRAVKCGKYSVMIIADCTGHGIPGAFLSMLGISALKEYCSTEADAENPGIVLDNMRAFIKSTLSNRGDKFIDDGMDMTMCCFDFENMQLRYAAANQVAYIVRNGEWIKLKGDNMPVGNYVREKEHFKTSVFDIKKGDMVYMFTDGIQDQIGGPHQKRLMRERLLKYLLFIADEPCDSQCDTVENIILEWKGDNMQVDDMTMVGIRV